MSNPQPARPESERPPGPHRPEIQLVTEDFLKSPTSPKADAKNGRDKDGSRDGSKGDSSSSDKDPTQQRFVLTDPVAFRLVPPALL